jgi:ABC-type lipoprotein release transport system permease subunit
VKTLFGLAVRNLRGAGLRTGLNAFSLSIAFVAIIFGQGLLQGVNRQAEQASVEYEVGGGQLWQRDYDPYNRSSLSKARQEIPAQLEQPIANQQAVPILVCPGMVIYAGMLIPVTVRGIPAGQQVLKIPSAVLNDTGALLPVLLGQRMAAATGLARGDTLRLQVRDKDFRVVTVRAQVKAVMTTPVPTFDEGQVWVAIERLWQLTGLEHQATVITLRPGYKFKNADLPGWNFQSPELLLKDLRQMVSTKSAGQSIFFLLLFLLAMLAIFDTQVFSIFRRRREIGTLVALGMTRTQVIGLFTLEGALYGVLAAALGAIYGLPLFVYLNRYGISFPGGSSWGFALEERLYPAYSISLIIGTALLVLVGATVVSWLPARRIARLKPTDALRGRWQ